MANKPISTENREATFNKVKELMALQTLKLDTLIDDLSKPHVDDKKVAKSLLSKIKKFQKKSEALLASV